jgi:hypothetical protein
MAEADEAAPGSAAAELRASRLWFRHRGLLWPALLLLAVLVLASWPWPNGLRISGRLVATAVSLTLKEAATVHSDLALRPPRVSITGAAAIEMPPGLGGASMRRQAMPIGALIAANNGTLLLSTLMLGPELDLTLQRGTRDGLTLLARGGDATIDFECGGNVVVRPDGAQEQRASLDPPEIIAVQTDRASAVPTSIQANTNDALAIENLLVSRLVFTRALSAGGRGSPFVSSVVSGNLQLVDTARSESLEAGAALVLEEFQGWVVHLESTSDGIAMSFTGTARRVRLGPLGHPNDLTPSVLEFLFHQEWIKMMWISALAGIAVIAKVRAWAVGKLED